MKPNLIITAMLITSVAMGQRVKEDTLFIESSKIKNIVIQGRNYRVLPPTLEEVFPPAPWKDYFLQPDGTLLKRDEFPGWPEIIQLPSERRPDSIIVKPKKFKSKKS